MVAAKGKPTANKSRVWVKTQEDLAAALEVSTTTIRTWIAKGLPAPTQRGYHVGKIKKWKETNIRPVNGAGSSQPSDRARLIKAQADKAEYLAARERLRNELEQGSYARIDAVHALMSAFLIEARTRLMRIPVDGKASYGKRADFYQKDTTARLDQFLKHMHHWLLKVNNLEHKPESK